MKTGGNSARGKTRRAIGGCAAALIVLGFYAAPAFAATSASADPAASAPMYEVADDSAAPAGGGASDTATAPAASSGPSSASSKAETIVVPDSEPEPPYVKRGVGMPQTTTEIPQASPSSPGDSSGSQIVNYESSQNPNVMDPQLHSLQEFISEGDNTSPLGIAVREARRKLKSGRAAEGLLIVDVANGSPAAKAGLRPYHRTVRDVLEVASVAAALVFPPAVVAVPIFDQVHIGETYDLIIAVDGSRVMNFLDFEDRMRDVQPGEIVYLSIIRDGVRMQVPVNVPATLPPPVF